MDIHAALRDLCAAFNAHDLDRITAFFADDCVPEMPRGPSLGARYEGAKAGRRGSHPLTPRGSKQDLA